MDSCWEEEIKQNWENTVPNLSDENLIWIFNSAQQITEDDQKILKDVVTKVVFEEIIKRRITLAINK